MKILVVDDTKENLYLLEVLLQGNGYEVVLAANGAEALEKLRAEHFDMIITDILMPVMDGFQFCREVKGDGELKDIPFVFYTATYVDEEDEQFALELGAEKFIRKPAEPDEFMKITRGVLGDAEAGRMALPKPVLEEGEVFKLYSERLVNKLEKKMLDLEREITERQRAEEELKKHHGHLEELVEERTAELTRANEQLEQEIAEHKRTEKELRDAYKRLQDIIEFLPDATFVINMDRKVIAWNRAMEEMTGVHKDEIMGKGDYAYAVPFYGVRRPILIDVVLSSDKEIKSLYDHVERRGNALIAEVFLPLMYEGKGGYFWGTAALLLNGEGNVVGAIESIRDITKRVRAEEELRQSYVQLRKTLEGTINVLVSVVETGDPYTAGHQRQVTKLACAMAKEMGLSEERIEGISMAGLIHDIGKINIPTEILSKPIRLSNLEYGLIQAHSQIGYDVLKEVKFPWPIAQIVLQHHERLDGSGYPQGLLGEEIMLEARILAVADVVEAMASRRPYRPPRGLDKALEEISQNRGILYDPEAVDACLELFAEKGFEFE